MADASWYAVHGPNGDLTWRVQSPAHYLNANVTLIPDSEPMSIYYPNVDSPFPWALEAELDDGRTVSVDSEDGWKKLASTERRLLNTRFVYPNHHGTSAVFTRPLSWLAAHMMEMCNQGIRVCAEVDDNYLSPNRLNVFMKKAGWDENDRNSHVRSICVGDALITSTAVLRDLYWKGLKAEFGKKHLPEMFVCRNHIDERFVPGYRVPPRDDGKLRIGYMGSDSHIWDVDLVHDALASAHEAGHQIVFVGISPGEMNPKFKKHLKTWKVPYTHVPWRNEGYRGDALPLDIGLAPLQTDHHTLGKSDIKIMEYALSGAACVAQNNAVYNRTFVHGETALLANSPREFHDRMWELIRDRRLRERLVAGTMQYIREERMLHNNINEWREAVFG